MIGRGRPLLPEMLDQSDRVRANLPIFDLYSLVATRGVRVDHFSYPTRTCSR